MTAKFPLIDKPAIVYCATNTLNGKWYVGATTRPLEMRVKIHTHDAKRGTNKGAFHKAIRKYGIGIFKWEILSAHPTAIDAAAQETQIIHEMCPPYNSTPGGLGFHQRVLSKDARLRISAKARERLAKNGHPFKGKRHSTESRQLMSEKLKGKPSYWKGKKRAPNVGAASRARLLARTPEEQRRILALGPKSAQKRTVCLDDGKIYEGASAAARAYGLDTSSVVAVCNRKRLQAGERVFRYEGEHYGGVEESRAIKMRVANSRRQTAKIARAKRRTPGGNVKPVRCKTDNRDFPSVQEAAKVYGMNPDTLSGLCRSGKPSRKGRLLFGFINENANELSAKPEVRKQECSGGALEHVR